jgi:hypothetical protein
MHSQFKDASPKVQACVATLPTPFGFAHNEQQLGKQRCGEKIQEKFTQEQAVE